MFPLTLKNKCAIKAHNYTDFIEGATSLTLMESKHHKDLGKTIYLFGNLHNRDSLCKRDQKRVINIADFIESVIVKNPDKIIDIFLESGTMEDLKNFGYHEPSYANGFLFGDTCDKFKDCLHADKSKCKYKNTRIHYADVRMKLIKDINPWSDYKALYVFARALLLFYSDLVLNQGNLPRTKLIELSQRLTDLTDRIEKHKIEDLNFNKLIEIAKINKQFDNIKSQELKAKLLSLIDTNITSQKGIKDTAKEAIIKSGVLLSVFDTLLNQNNINSILYTLKPILPNIISKTLFAFEHSTYMSIMDSYLLGRLFRSYSKGPDSKYVIIFVGEEHAKIYRSILPNLGFKVVNETINNPVSNCVDISKFKQPFFS